MVSNSNLVRAKITREDEYYTQLPDIENELKHYKEHFIGKTVLCNCDDPRVSNFFRYFSLNFEHLQLKKLICTCYKNQDIDMFSQNAREQAVYTIYEGDINGNRNVDTSEIKVIPLKGDGDYNSPECIELLKQADIVVTNPPFSKLNHYIRCLCKYNKQFLIIANHNVVHYPEVFPLIKDNKIWLGYNNVKAFMTPDGTLKKFGNVCWITNLDIKKRHENLILFKHYDPVLYPTYCNCNAIDVEKVSDIPVDYDGIMGVPDTILDNYNPEQFDLLGADGVLQYAEEIGIGRIGEEWINLYRSNGGTGHISANMRGLVLIKNGVPKKPYSRILIRIKK